MHVLKSLKTKQKNPGKPTIFSYHVSHQTCSCALGFHTDDSFHPAVCLEANVKNITDDFCPQFFLGQLPDLEGKLQNPECNFGRGI